MHQSMKVFLINEHVRAMAGNYDAEFGKGVDRLANATTLFKTFDPAIKVGDIVVIPSGTRHGFTTVKITEADVAVDFDSSTEFKWIVSKVDMTNYDLILTQEAEALKTIQSAESTKRKKDLAGILFADAQAKIAALPLANAGAPVAPPPPVGN